MWFSTLLFVQHALPHISPGQVSFFGPFFSCIPKQGQRVGGSGGKIPLLALVYGHGPLGHRPGAKKHPQPLFCLKIWQGMRWMEAKVNARFFIFFCLLIRSGPLFPSLQGLRDFSPKERKGSNCNSFFWPSLIQRFFKRQFFFQCTFWLPLSTLLICN